MERDERIKLALAQIGLLRGEMNRLISIVDSCDPEAVLQMQKVKDELNFTFNADLIHMGNIVQ